MSIQIIDISHYLWEETLKKIRHDFYHLPEYLDLEARRINALPEAFLIVDDEKIFFVPYLLQKCNDIGAKELTTKEAFFDIISPYGYSGILVSEAAAKTPSFLSLAINQFIKTLEAKQICSAFLRLHPILNYDIHSFFENKNLKFNGKTISINLKLSPSEIWHQTRADHRNGINRCKKLGMTAKIVPFKEYIDQFIHIYEQTMARVEASKSYYFGREYFLGLLDALGKKLHLCIVELNDVVICAGLFSECCGIVQYHLSGTRNEFLKQFPSKLMLDYVRLWAKERGNEIFHLGGGVGGSKDSLYTFKAGFSQQEHNFITVRLLLNEKKYLDLVELRAKVLNTDVGTLLTTDFFPAYRINKI